MLQGEKEDTLEQERSLGTLFPTRNLLLCSAWKVRPEGKCSDLKNMLYASFIVLKSVYWFSLPILPISFFSGHIGLPNFVSVMYSSGALRELKVSNTVSILLAELQHMIALKFSPVSLSRRQ